MKKQDILEAIQRTAKANGGKSLGTATFSRETGIQVRDWNKYWARWGDAVREAGYEPNAFQVSYGAEALLIKLIEFTKKLGRIPVSGELKLEAHATPEFPDYGTLTHNLGPKKKWCAKIIEYCRTHPGYEDVLSLCSGYPEDNEPENSEPTTEEGNGWVYLLKSGKFYKIGRTNNLARRRGQLAIQLPESLEIIHQIRTDDTAGIEAYWHKRFETKRKEGEWFELSSHDVRAFKRRKTFM